MNAPRAGTRALRSVRPPRLTLALGVVLFLPASVNGDGGIVRFAGRVGDYQITIFTAPNPFRAGPVDISVFVQDVDTGEPVPAARVELRLTAPGRAPLRCAATRAAATNKLFHAAKFDLPAAGRWRVELRVDGARGAARRQIELDAGEPLPPWSELWAWVLLPIVPIVLFVVHQALVRRTGAGRSPARKTIPKTGDFSVTN